MRTLLVGCVVVAFLGCGRDVAPAFEDPTRSVTVVPPILSTRERLELEPTTFRIQPLDALGSFTARRVLADVASPVPLRVNDGWFEAYADSQSAPTLVVSRFDGSLDDVRFDAKVIPPNGLTLTRVHFAQVKPAALSVRWFAGSNLGWAKGTITVDIHTSLLLSNGMVSPLDVARLEVPVELTVSQTEHGVLGLWLQVAREGSLWNWAGLFELNDLTLSLEAFQEEAVTLN
jgi:hypothetical protein